MTAIDRVALLLAGAILALGSCAVLAPIDDPYPHTYQGSLLAICASWAETMSDRGFVATRFMPALNTNATEHPGYRYYVTHPVLDTVVRAALVRVLGAAEWVMRLQGVVGCFVAALLLFLLLRRRMPPLGAAFAAAGMASTPVFRDVALMSMYYPLGLATALGGLLLLHRRRESGSRPALAGMHVCFFASMQTDWPGYLFVLVTWLAQLASAEGRRDRAVVVGLPALVALSLTITWLHVDLIALWPGAFVERLRGASVPPGPTIFELDGLDRFATHQVAAYGPITLGITVAALASCTLVRSGRRFLPLVFFAFLYGAANVLAFPGKAPWHDFWGCHFLPLAGVSWGVVATVGADGAGRALGRRGRWLALVGLGALLLAATLMRQPRAESDPTGAEMKRLAQAVATVVPEGEDVLFVSDHLEIDYAILGAYLRQGVMPWDRGAAEIDLLPAAVQEHFFHLRGARVLFVVGPRDGRDGEQRRRALQRALARVGTPLGGGEDGVIYDVTRFAWSSASKR